MAYSIKDCTATVVIISRIVVSQYITSRPIILGKIVFGIDDLFCIYSHVHMEDISMQEKFCVKGSYLIALYTNFSADLEYSN